MHGSCDAARSGAHTTPLQSLTQGTMRKTVKIATCAVCVAAYAYIMCMCGLSALVSKVMTWQCSACLNDEMRGSSGHTTGHLQPPGCRPLPLYLHSLLASQPCIRSWHGVCSICT